MFARCNKILEELTHASDFKIIQWTNISKNVAHSFLRYLYTGVLNLEIDTFVEWNEAKSIAEKYGLALWKCFVESLRDDYDQTIFD